MATQNSDRKYDRDFLLSPEKRNQVVELWEVEKTGHLAFSGHQTFIREDAEIGAAITDRD